MLEPLFRDKEDLASLVYAAASLVPLPTLLVYVARPKLLQQLDTVPLLLVLSGIGVGMLMTTMIASEAVAHGAQTRRKTVRVAEHVARTGMLPGVDQNVDDSPAKDWPRLQLSASLSNSTFLALVLWSYWNPVRLGATLALVCTVLLVGSFLLRGLLATAPLSWTHRQLDDLVKRRVQAAQEGKS